MRLIQLMQSTLRNAGGERKCILKRCLFTFPKYGDCGSQLSTQNGKQILICIIPLANQV